MTARALAMMYAAVLLLDARLAHACSVPDLVPYELVEDESDVTPPAKPSLAFSVERGRPPEREGCSQQVSSCDDVGRLTLVLDEDDEGGETDLGYVIELVAGDLNVPREGEPVQAREGELLLTWADGEGADDVALVLDVWSVDRAGNRSSEATRVEIRSAGRANGCATTTLGTGAGAWLLAGLALLARARGRKLPA